MNDIDVHSRYTPLDICGDCLQISANGKRDIDPDILERYEEARALEGGEPTAHLYDEEDEFTYTEFSKSPCGFCRSTLAGSRYPARLHRLFTPTTDDVWELTEKAPRYAWGISHLWSWSLNYDNYHARPWEIFLWLIGHESMDGLQPSPIGYVAGDCMALDYLADALAEYSLRPAECMEYVEAICSARG